MADYSFLADDHAAVASATKILLSRYRQYVTYEDVQQELYLWLLQHTDRANSWRANYSEKHAERTLIKALRNAGERYCRTEKAEQIGYAPEDEFFYSIPMIADLLAMSFDPEWMVPSGIDYTSPRRRGRPASEGDERPTMVADVTRAYEKQPEADQKLLRFVYGGSRTTSDAIACLSIRWGCSQSAANSRVRRVVGRIRATLGGENPWKQDREEDPACLVANSAKRLVP